MSSLIITLLIMAVCVYFGIIYVNEMLISCAFIIGTLVVFSVLEVVWQSRKLRVKMQTPIGLVEKGQKVNITLFATKKGQLPLGRMQACICIEDDFGEKGKKEWITFSGLNQGSHMYELEIIANKAGYYEVVLERVRIYALTGMVSIGKRQKESIGFLVLPSLYMMGVEVTEGVRGFIGDADVHDDLRPGNDPTQVFDVREYRPKDKMQHIHWKLSVRTEDLMVKEFSMPKPCAVILLLDARKEKRQHVEGAAFLEIAASLSFHLVEKECPHFVAWYSKTEKDLIRTRVDDEESFYLFLNYFMKDMEPTADIDLAKEYKEKYCSERYLHTLCLNTQLELSKDGDFVKKWTGQNIADECEELELSI